jgi:histidine triad (HIT) family protein
VAVPSIFTRIIDGELPGVFVWRDTRCVAFLSVNPMHPGHTLVVPREEVDHWIDLDADLTAHLFGVAQTIGRAQDRALDARRIGVLIVGDEVPHVHIHVVPFDSAGELTFAHADPHPPEGSLEAAAAKIRAALRDLGADSVSE